MSWRRQLAKIGALFRRPKPVADLEEEIRSHLQMEEQDNLEAGMSPDEAHYATLRRFGNVTLAQQRSREMWGWNWAETLWQDLRYGLRQLRRSPGFTIVAALTLALGIGANTAIFSLVNAVLLRQLPYRDPNRLVYISEFWPRETPVQTVPSPDFANWSEDEQLFDGLAAYGGGAEVNLTSDREPERVQGVTVTSDFFSLLRVQPIRERGFLPEEDRPGGPHVVLLSHELWHERFGSDPSVVGKSVKLDGVPHTIVGIIPAGFRFPDDQFKARLFLPMVVARVAN